jgi:ribosomal protein S12 methylthiotransferase
MQSPNHNQTIKQGFSFYIMTLGCPKNQVDSQRMEGLLREAGGSLANSPREAEIVIVNTCGFIEEAKKESIECIISLSKSSPTGQMIIGAGCLSERYGERLLSDMPELSATLGTRRWNDIVPLIEVVKIGQRVCWTGDPATEQQANRRISSASAYLKIADGCSAGCSFCAIPDIKGPLHSLTVPDCVAEAQSLVAQGVQELNLIAQDTTAFGHDRGEADGLSNLIEALVAEVPGSPWIRIMYTHPQRVTEQLITTIAKHQQVLNYIDLPLQHSNPNVLRRMRRPPEGAAGLVQEIRKKIPDIAIRTSFIVGFPGETERQFQDLLDFIETMSFDWVGIFTYSQEEGTAAASLPAQIPRRVKRRRYRQAMELQQGITKKRNFEQIGRTLQVLVEGDAPHRLAGRNQARSSLALIGSVARSYREAPEVDGVILLGQQSIPGTIIPVRITGNLIYDLIGTPEPDIGDSSI